MHKVISYLVMLAALSSAVMSCDSKLEDEQVGPEKDTVKVTLNQLVGKWQLTAASLIQPLQIENIFTNQLMKDAWCTENSQLTFGQSNRYIEFSRCNLDNDEEGTYTISPSETEVFLDYDRDSLGIRTYSFKSYSFNEMTVEYVDSALVGSTKIGFVLNYKYSRI